VKRARASSYSDACAQKGRASLLELPKAAQPRVQRARASICSDAWEVVLQCPALLPARVTDARSPSQLGRMMQQMPSLPLAWVAVGGHPPSVEGCTSLRSAPRTGDRCEVTPPSWKDEATHAVTAPSVGGSGGHPPSVEGCTSLRSAPRTGGRCKVNPPARKDDAANAITVPMLVAVEEVVPREQRARSNIYSDDRAQKARALLLEFIRGC